MSTLSDLKLDEKELSICMIPMNILQQNETEIVLEDDEMAVYIPKLMSSLSYEQPKVETIKIDYSIVQNKEFSNKKMEVCNYLLVKPYTENNLSPQLFNKGEKCFTKFLYKDIKQAYFTSDNLGGETERLQDVKTLSVASEDDKYELTLDSINKQIRLGNTSNQVLIDQENKCLSVFSDGSQINLKDGKIEIKSTSINILGELTINGNSLETMIRKIVAEIISEGEDVE